MKFCSILFVALTAFAFTARAASSIIVNEYFNGTGPTSAATKMVNDEYIEFAITASMTSTQLAALTFGDSNNSTSALQGVFQFDKPTLDSALAGAGLSAFQAGTIIVVKGTGLGAQNLTYNPLATNTGNSDLWSIELVAGQGALDHSETLINGNINIASSGDVIWISSDNPPTSNTDVSGFLDAIGHDTSPGYIANQVIAQFGASHILNSNLSNNSVIANTGNATVVLTQTTTTSMATPNSAANSTWLTGVRASSFVVVPEPSRTILLLAGIAACILRRQRTFNPKS